MSPFLVSISQDVPWRNSSFAPGVQVKDLGNSDGTFVQMVRFAPGVRFPFHQHKGPEIIYLMQGAAVQQGKELLPGSVSIAPAGTSEDDFYSPNGCEFLLIYSE